MRVCIGCDSDKREIDFPDWGGRKTNVCRVCHNAYKSQSRRNAGVLTKEQRNAYMREYRIKNKDALLAKETANRKKAPLNRLWRQVSSRKSSLNITHENFMALEIPSSCPILGIPISYDLGRDNFPSIDRIDPNRPYEISNIAIVSYRANMIKSVGSAKEHELIAKWLCGLGAIGEFAGKSLSWGNVRVGKSSIRFGRNRESLGGEIL